MVSSQVERSTLLEKYTRALNPEVIEKAEEIPDLQSQVHISVVVPTYFEERTIPNLLDSLATQIFQNFEVIVVDNGSRDRTLDVIERKKAELPIQISLITEMKPGPGNARKTGIDVVAQRLQWSREQDINNHIIVTTDADVVVPPTWLLTIQFILADERIGIIGGSHSGSPWVDETIENTLGIKIILKELLILMI